MERLQTALATFAIPGGQGTAVPGLRCFSEVAVLPPALHLLVRDPLALRTFQRDDGRRVVHHPALDVLRRERRELVQHVPQPLDAFRLPAQRLQVPRASDRTDDDSQRRFFVTGSVMAIPDVYGDPRSPRSAAQPPLDPPHEPRGLRLSSGRSRRSPPNADLSGRPMRRPTGHTHGSHPVFGRACPTPGAASPGAARPSQFATSTTRPGRVASPHVAGLLPASAAVRWVDRLLAPLRTGSIPAATRRH